MSYPKKYQGLPNRTLYTGQTVEAAHIQAICDWLRWYIVYFNPSHCSHFTWGGQYYANSSGSYGPSYSARYSMRNRLENNTCFLFGCFPDYVEKICASFYGLVSSVYNNVITKQNPNLLVAPTSYSTSVTVLWGEGIEGFYDLWQQAYIPQEAS